MKVYVSVSSYVLGSLMGPVRACDLISEACADSSKRPPCFAVRAIRDLTRMADVTLKVDGGASHLGKSRSRHFFAACESDCDAWVSIDDDVTASRETLEWLLAAVDDVAPRVCIAPCLMRGNGLVNVEWSPVYVERTIPTGGSTRRAVAGGFGLVAVNRAALEAISKSALTWLDKSDGRIKPAPFFEVFTESEWLGEDISFFRRLPRTVEVEALTTGQTMHAGHALALESLT